MEKCRTHGPGHGAAYRCSEPSLIPRSYPGELGEQWIRLRHLSIISCGPRFKSQLHRRYFFMIYLIKTSRPLSFYCKIEPKIRNKLNQAKVGNFFNKAWAAFRGLTNAAAAIIQNKYTLRQIWQNSFLFCFSRDSKR